MGGGRLGEGGGVLEERGEHLARTEVTWEPQPQHCPQDRPPPAGLVCTRR